MYYVYMSLTFYLRRGNRGISDTSDKSTYYDKDLAIRNLQSSLLKYIIIMSTVFFYLAFTNPLKKGIELLLFSSDTMVSMARNAL
jgi:hypothetical protein